MAQLYLLLILGAAAVGAAVAATASLKTVRDPRLTRWLTAILAVVMVAGIMGEEVSPVAQQLRSSTLFFLLAGLIFLVVLLQGAEEEQT